MRIAQDNLVEDADGEADPAADLEPAAQEAEFGIDTAAEEAIQEDGVGEPNTPRRRAVRRVPTPAVFPRAGAAARSSPFSNRLATQAEDLEPERATDEDVLDSEGRSMLEVREPLFKIG
jgi:hypothetical protein